MRSNFRRIGNYIQPSSTRNSNLAVTNLQGVNINKVFMPSVANINGTDLSTYKVVTKEQFAFNPMHVGRDEVLPIAMLETDDPIIVSPAYAVFEVFDKQALLPEYLMMWCSRPEFDRNAWFTTDSSIRGGFSWDDFCEMALPVPSIEKQQEIVKEYHTIVDRINLNERLNQKLEDTAQTIYKQWFVNFEFPISAECAAAIGKPELEGQSYKSSGGEMVYNEVLKQEIPKGWLDCLLSAKIEFKNGKTRPSTKGNIPVYGGNGILDYVANHNYANVVAIGRVGAYCGSLYRVIDKCWISDNAICAKSKDGRNGLSYYLLRTLSLNERSEGTGQPLLTQELLNKIQIINANSVLDITFDEIASRIDQMLALVKSEIDHLHSLSALLLSSLAQKK